MSKTDIFIFFFFIPAKFVSFPPPTLVILSEAKNPVTFIRRKN